MVDETSAHDISPVVEAVLTSDVIGPRTVEAAAIGYVAGQPNAQIEMRLLFWSATQTVLSSSATAASAGKLNWLGPEPVVPKVAWLVQTVLVALGRVQIETRFDRRTATHAVRPSSETATPSGSFN